MGSARYVRSSLGRPIESWLALLIPIPLFSYLDDCERDESHWPCSGQLSLLYFDREGLTWRMAGLLRPHRDGVRDYVCRKLPSEQVVESELKDAG